MNDKIMKTTLAGIATVVGGVFATVTVNVLAKTASKSIESNNEKEKEILNKRIREFELRKERAIELEKVKQEQFEEQKIKLENLKEEIRNLNKVKNDLEDNSNLVTVMSVLMADIKEIKCELKQVRNEIEYLK